MAVLISFLLIAQLPPDPTPKTLLEIDVAERAQRQTARKEIAATLAKDRQLLKRIEANSRIDPKEATTIPADEAATIVFKSKAQKDKYISLGRAAVRAAERRLAGLDRTEKPPRTPHPELPDIAILTEAEKAYVAQVIKDAILDDLGKLPKGKDALEVRRAIRTLPREAFPQLLEAFIFVANEGWTCPANIIAGTGRFGNLTWNHNVPRTLDYLAFVNKYIGVGAKNPSPLQAYKDVKITVERELKKALEEIVADLNVRTTAEVIELAEKRQGLEWKQTIKAIGEKSDAAACVFLVKCLKERNERERPVILDSLATWAGIDEKAEERQSQGAILDAAEKKRAKLASK